MSVAVAADQAAQPLIVNAPEDVPDEEAGVIVQTEIAEVKPFAAVQDSGREGPVWPDEAAESVMRAEVSERGETLNSKAARELAEAAAEAAAEKKGLPSLDTLVNQIPADVRDTLDELFRVKFVKVARVPKKVLKE